MRYFPNQSLNFALKDTFKKYFPKYNPEKNFYKFLLINCLSGGLAGGISLIVLHPIDCVRTRLATDNKNKEIPRKFNGTTDCIKKIYLYENGIKGFYPGLIVSVVALFNYRAIYFGGYDTVKVMFPSENRRFIHKWIIAQIVTYVASLLVYPLDTVRRRIIIQSGLKEKK